MKLNAAGIRAGWEVDASPFGRVMGDFIQTPYVAVAL
jgi:hypothetical protein